MQLYLQLQMRQLQHRCAAALNVAAAITAPGHHTPTATGHLPILLKQQAGLAYSTTTQCTSTATGFEDNT